MSRKGEREKKEKKMRWRSRETQREERDTQSGREKNEKDTEGIEKRVIESEGQRLNVYVDKRY